jgi:hypothetical protein
MFHASMEVVGAAELVRVHAKTAIWDTTGYDKYQACYLYLIFYLKVRTG